MNENVLALFTVFRGILNTELCHNGRKNVGNCQKRRFHLRNLKKECLLAALDQIPAME